MVGDGSYLMLSAELITAVQEGIKITVVLLDNQGYGSIGSLSESVGSEGFGTYYRYRTHGKLEGSALPMDFVMNARRSEEHTSELQSRGHLVCRLLLEIKYIYCLNH